MFGRLTLIMYAMSYMLHKLQRKKAIVFIIQNLKRPRNLSMTECKRISDYIHYKMVSIIQSLKVFYQLISGKNSNHSNKLYSDRQIGHFSYYPINIRPLQTVLINQQRMCHITYFIPTEMILLLTTECWSLYSIIIK